MTAFDPQRPLRRSLIHAESSRVAKGFDQQGKGSRGLAAVQVIEAAPFREC
jgi:hypothetical protein